MSDSLICQALQYTQLLPAQCHWTLVEAATHWDKSLLHITCGEMRLWLLSWLLHEVMVVISANLQQIGGEHCFNNLGKVHPLFQVGIREPLFMCSSVTEGRTVTTLSTMSSSWCISSSAFSRLYLSTSTCRNRTARAAVAAMKTLRPPPSVHSTG